MSGCFFHLSQSYIRYIAKSRLKKYEINHETALALKNFFSFDKKEDIEKSIK